MMKRLAYRERVSERMEGMTSALVELAEKLHVVEAQRMMVGLKAPGRDSARETKAAMMIPTKTLYSAAVLPSSLATRAR